MREERYTTNGTDDLAHLRYLLTLAPRDCDLRLRLAESLIERSLSQDALRELEAVIRIDPNNLAARKLRGKLIG
jgi:thioredoxin-like negative regulator of GroEL